MALTSNIRTGESVDDVQFRQFKIFNDVDLDGIRPLLNLCRKERLDSGAVLLRPELGNNSMYLLLSGKVSISLESLDSTPLLELGPGECLGEMSVFDGRNPSAYVTVIEPSEILVIEGNTLWQLIDSSHSLCRNLLHFLSNRLRSGNDLMTITRSKEKEQEHSANSDALTGLNNRRWLQEYIASLDERSLSDIIPLAVLMVDVDHFKRYNDNYGHQSGDLVLQMVARTIRQSLRPSDMVARFGGEEFIVFLPHTPVQQAEVVAERLRFAVERCKIAPDQDQSLPSVTISLGISTAKIAENIEAAIERADQALYLAKKAGRNRFKIQLI
jgi:diguanylate cyclase (GGDEF)-like protein